jgi:hypothetical protein
MNSTKPRSRVCTCGTTFEVAARNQRYCPRCRAARAEAMEALRNKVCRHCHAEKSSTKNGICNECREAKQERWAEAYEQRMAAKLERVNANGGCKHCGAVATMPEDGLCGACYLEECRRLEKKHEDDRKARREHRLSEDRANRPAQPKDESSDSDADSAVVEILLLLLPYILGGRSKKGKKPDASPVEEVQPEWIDADNQAAVDAAFAQLMEGFEL